MKRGDVIRVRLYSGEIVERVVWQVEPTWVMACRREVYDETVRDNLSEPERWMGFPKDSIVAVESEAIAV